MSYKILGGFILAMILGATAPSAAAQAEPARDPRAFVRYAVAKRPVAAPALHMERITAAVPWPRGLCQAGDKIVVLARGRHRNAGGVDGSIADHSGSLFVIDPGVAEPYEIGRPAGEAVRTNAALLAAPSGAHFRLHDPARGTPEQDTAMDRPYCTLAYDAVSQNYFICGFSGVDLPNGRFRKNATDSIHRFDSRTRAWHVVESHDPAVVPVSELGAVVPNRYYPHHDPDTAAAPHGWLNGPDGATVAGEFLYAVGKDNHTLVQYDLETIRRKPDAGAPESRVVFGERVAVRLPQGVQEMPVLGHSALAVHGGHLYVGFRTSSAVLRFPLDARGDVIRPLAGELIAVFEPWSDVEERSANLVDIAFNRRGELFVSCASHGRIWNAGVPDPSRPFNGIDAGAAAVDTSPWVDIRKLTENPKGKTGNILFDDQGRLYVCSGNYDSGTTMAGVIYRFTELEASRQN